MHSKRALLGAFFGTVAISVAAQEPTTLHVESRLATADVTVLDKRTHVPVENLTAADFRVFDNDHPQPITRFSLVGKDDRPLAVVLLVEVFGYDTDVNAKLPGDARLAFAHLRPDDRVAVVAWGVLSPCKEEVALTQPFTASVPQIVASLQQLSELTTAHHNASPKDRPRQNTHMTKKQRQEAIEQTFKKQDEALHLAAATLDLQADSRKELIAIDQDFSMTTRTSADNTADDLLAANLSLNAIIKPSFFIGMAKGMLHTVDGNQYQTALLAYYADQTGGTVLSPKRDDTGKALEQLLFGIRAEYSLGWKPTAGNGFHKIRVELVHSGPQVHHKSGYYVVSPPVSAPPPPLPSDVPPPSL